MKNYLDFKGKKAVVTGGRRGIGRAIALALAERGAEVLVIARNPDGSAILNELEQAGTPGFYLDADLSVREQRTGLIAKAVEKLGSLDILVNNAGMQYHESLETCTLEHWDFSRSILLDAVFELSQQAVPFLKQRGGGKIIHIASICSFREGGWTFGYGVMKSAVAGMTRCMANTLAKEKINVNAIAPGIIRTDLTEGQGCFNPESYERIIQKYPARRLGEPEEIASTLLFLASEMSSFINGQTIIADGGFCGN